MRGFTLVELSIVLVIIGLIVGGIVGGQSLIRSAELSTIVREVNAIKVAVRAYQLQYDAMPGDQADAAEYFSGCINASSNPCNGNGDGKIQLGAGSYGATNEFMQAWQHLSLSGIVGESYDGGYNSLPGVGKPISVAAGGAGYNINYQTVYQRTGHVLTLAINGGLMWSLGALLTKEAKSIDKKMDDGKADSGDVRTTNGHQALIANYPDQQTCVTNAMSSAMSSYILSNQNRSCTMIFSLD